MDISLIMKIAGIGIAVTVACQMLRAAGRDEQSVYVSIAGILVAIVILIEEIGGIFQMIGEVFGF